MDIAPEILLYYVDMTTLGTDCSADDIYVQSVLSYTSINK